MSPGDEKLHRQNARAWDLAAGKYAAEVEQDVAQLQASETSLLPAELRLLGDLSTWCGLAIHLQCSHGQDALSLWKLGAREVIGVDISAEMLKLAEQKARRLGANARWYHCDVLHVPGELDGSADLVYTGKGALPWMMDLAGWAGVVARLLKPGGRLLVFEGHPLNWVWEPQAEDFILRSDSGDYFSPDPRPNRDFPASAVERYTPPGEGAPQSFERQWTLGEILTALAQAGLRLERLEEYPEHFWPQFESIPQARLRRLPHTFGLVMSKR